jgi:hypothetical protein
VNTKYIPNATLNSTNTVPHSFSPLLNVADGLAEETAKALACGSASCPALSAFRIFISTLSLSA